MPQMNGTSREPTDQQFHEHKGPLTRLKDGIFNLISSGEDTIKMEMYTEYIGVCKYCFDPRTSPYDAPRRHHYHTASRRDSFEDMRKRRSIERMRRSSKEQLGRAGSTRVDKDSRYYSSDKRKSGSKTDLVGAGLAAAGVAAGANALFNSDGKNFDDTYSVKSGHRESSAVRRRSRSSSRERRRRSSHGVVGRVSRDEYVVVRNRNGQMERRKVHRSRSRSRDHTAGMMAGGAGTALGASSMAAGRSRRSRDTTPNGAFIRRRTRSRSSSESSGGIFGGFFSPSLKKGKGSRPERRKKQGGFFGFGNDAASSSDLDLAFGASKTDLPLRRKSSMKSTRRKKSDEHLAATVAGIGATAAALAAAQKGQRITKQSSRPQLGARRDVKTEPISRPYGEPPSRDDEWEDELPSDVEDASSGGSELAFGDYDRKPSHRQSMESLGSQSSGAGGLSAWGWRWGGKDKKKQKRRDAPSRPSYSARPEGSIIAPAAAEIAAGAVTGMALDAARKSRPSESGMTSASSVPQQPLQYVDPRPMSEAGSMSGSRHASMPGAFDSPPLVARPGPAPLQQPQPVTPVQPAFTQGSPEMDDRRPKPRRTQSSPVQSTFAQDAALIGAAAVGTTALIASQRRKSKDVRFGLTDEQERKHERERREEDEQRAEEERRRAGRTRVLKEEAERHSREAEARAREDEDRRLAEAELERQRAAQRQAQQQAEMERQREREARELEARGRPDHEMGEQLEEKKRELKDQHRVERERRAEERKEYDPQDQDDSSSVPWSAVAAGAAAAGVGAVALSQHERSKIDERGAQRDDNEDHPPPYETREISPDDRDIDRVHSMRSPSPDYARRVDALARKAAGKVVSARDVVTDTDAYYKEPQQTQAEFFAPDDILHQPAEGKTKVADPIDDNTVHVYNAEDVRARDTFRKEYGGTSSGRSNYAPYGVPELDLISPTPPPSSISRKPRTPSPSPLAQEEVMESEVEEGAKKSSRSRSVSWGADQTHIYDVPTPDSHHEGDEYIESHDIPVAAAMAAGMAAAGIAAGVAVHENADEPSFAERATSNDEDDASRDFNYSDFHRVETLDDEADIDDSAEAPPLHQRPFHRSVSDIAFDPFKVDSPGTEGAPPVRGFVEGEVDEPPAEEEKAPHIPGGFDDDYQPSAEPTPEVAPYREAETSMETEEAAEPVSIEPTEDAAAREATPPVEESWEPPLSKKEKKKREKAAKRAEAEDTSSQAQPTPDTREVAPETPPAPVESEDYFPSKKDKKKRGKALKRGMSEDQAPIMPETKIKQPEFEPLQEATREPEPESFWEPPLSKKEKKKRDKAARNQGFADVAETVMTAGGIAAVAGAVAHGMGESSTNVSADLGKGKDVDRDPRDIEPSTTIPSETTDRNFSGMPGGWGMVSQDKDVETPSEAVDPFQYQVHDDGQIAPPAGIDPSRDIASRNIPSELGRDDDILDESKARSSSKSQAVYGQTSTSISDSAPPYSAYTAGADQYVLEDHFRTSPDDSRSIASEPIQDRSARRVSYGRDSQNESQYYDEPEACDDLRSVAASEPADTYGSSRKSKRRSRQANDDETSTVSSRSKREKQASSSSKDKKGGLFGLFGRKTSEVLDDGSSSRRSTKEDKDDESVYSEGKRERRRKHRDSEYGNEYDSRNIASEPAGPSPSTRDYVNEDGHDTYEDKYYEDGYRDQYGQRPDEDEYETSRKDSERSSRHHHRRRTEDETYDDQSFLGMRVEDMPPLPDSRPVSPGTASAKQEQDDGNLVSVEPDTHLISRDHANAFGLIRHEIPSDNIAADDKGAASNRDVQQELLETSAKDDTEALPALPDSRAGSPTAPLEVDTADRPSGLQRPTSMTAVPLRFPFGNQPLTPSNRIERAISFGGSLPTSPASPTSAQRMRQGRHGSTEIRPLYLVERNRKTPEVEEMLPSLPSSRPSSRASSMVGSDKYEDADDGLSSSERMRGLTIDTDHPYESQAEDYLDSQQTTPRAGEFPVDTFDRPPRQEPQFYTWEDFAREERLRNDSTAHFGEAPPVEYFDPRVGDEATQHGPLYRGEDQERSEDLPQLPPSRPDSPTDLANRNISAAAGVAAAAAMGGAAVLGYHLLNSHDRERDTYPEENHHSALEDQLSQQGRRAGGLDQGMAEDPSVEVQAPLSPSAMIDEPSSRDVDNFVTSERLMEEGTSPSPIHAVEIASPSQAHEVDRFLHTEEQMEEGTMNVKQAQGTPVDVYQSLPTSRVAISGNRSLDPTPEEQQPVVTSPHDLETLETDDALSRDQTLPDAPREETFSPMQSRGFQPDDLVIPSEDEEADKFMDAEERMEAGHAADEPEPEHAVPENTEISSRTSLEHPNVTEVASQVHQAKEEQPSNALDQSQELAALDETEEQDIVATLPSAKLTKKQLKKAKKKKKKGKATSKEVPDTTSVDRDVIPDPQGDDIYEASTPEAWSLPEDTLKNDTHPGPAAGFATSGASVLSQAMRRGSNNEDAGLKANGSSLASTAAATVHTSLDSAASPSALQLTASLEPDDIVRDEESGRNVQAPIDTGDDHAHSLAGPGENPILQPEQDETWEAFPVTSRKKSKKNKKKEQRRAQQGVELPSDSLTDTKAETYDVEMRDVVTDVEQPIVDDNVVPMDLTTTEDTADPAAVPLPTTDDHDLEPVLESTLPQEPSQPLSDHVPPETQPIDSSAPEMTSRDNEDVISTNPSGIASSLGEISDNSNVLAHELDRDMPALGESAPVVSTGPNPHESLGSVEIEQDGMDGILRTEDASRDIKGTHEQSESDAMMFSEAPEFGPISPPSENSAHEMAPPSDEDAIAPREAEMTTGVSIDEAEDVPMQEAEASDSIMPLDDQQPIVDVSQKKPGFVAEGDDFASEPAVSKGPSESSKDSNELSGDFPSMQDPASREVDAAQDPEEEFMWASSKKKGKKGKKAKKSTAAPPSFSEQPEDIQNDKDPSGLATTGDLITSEPPTSPAEVTEKDPGSADTSWEPFASKKKKGKKGKKSTFKTIQAQDEEEQLLSQAPSELQETPADIDSAEPQSTLTAAEAPTFDATPIGDRSLSSQGLHSTEHFDQEVVAPEESIDETRNIAGEPMTPMDVVVDESAVNELSVEDPTNSEPTFAESVFKESMVEEPTVEESTVGEPMIETPVVEKSVVGEPAIEEHVVAEPIINEAVSGETILEQPTIEKATLDDFVAPAFEPKAMDTHSNDPPPRLHGEIDTTRLGKGIAAEDGLGEEDRSRAEMITVAEEQVSQEPSFEEPPAPRGITSDVPHEADSSVPAHETDVEQLNEAPSALAGAPLSGGTPTIDAGQASELAVPKQSDERITSEPSQGISAASRSQDDVPEPGQQAAATELTETTTGDDTEALWAPIPIKQKGKKGKKGKKSVTASGTSARSAQQESAEILAPPQESVDQSVTGISSEIDKNFEQTADVEAVDFWPTFMKGKKGKKSRKATLLDPKATVTSQEETREAEDPEAQAVNERSIDLDAIPALPKASEEVEPASFWAAPAKGKKGKKGKKSKRAIMETEPFGTYDEAPAAAEELDLPSEADPMVERPVAEAQDQMMSAEPSMFSAIDEQTEAPTFDERRADDGTDSLPPLPESPLDAAPEDTSWTEYAAQPAAEDLLTDNSNVFSDAQRNENPAEVFASMDSTHVPSNGNESTLQPGEGEAMSSVSEAGASSESVQFGSEPMDIDKHELKNATTLDVPSNTTTEVASEKQMDVHRSMQDTAEPHETTEALPEESVQYPDDSVVPQARDMDVTFDEDPAHTRDLQPENPVKEYDRALGDAERKEGILFDDAAAVPLPEEDLQDIYIESPVASHMPGPSDQEDREINEPAGRVEHIRSSIGEAAAPATRDDLEFATDVAKGLADSGFDPNIVAEDSAFQRRASPSEKVAEADPEEVFTSTSKKKKKGKKGKKASEADVTRTVEGPSDLVEPYDQASASNDFNETLEKTLAGSGFDAELLQRAISSSNNISSNEVTEDPMEYSFQTSKRKKGKKAKKGQSADVVGRTPEYAQEGGSAGRAFDKAFELDEIVDDSQPAYTDNVLEASTNEAKPEPLRSPTVISQDEGLVPAADPLAEAPHTGDVSHIASQVPQSAGSFIEHDVEGSTVFEEPTVQFSVAGDRDLDIDEMDRAFENVRKSKRNKKKQKAVAAKKDTTLGTISQQEAAEPASRIVSTADTSTSPFFEDPTGAPQTSRDAEDLDELQPRANNEQDTNPVSPTSIVQSTFPGLERVRRRKPSTHSPTEHRRRSNEFTASQGSEGLLHTSEVSQTLPVAVRDVTSPVEATMPEKTEETVEEREEQPSLERSLGAGHDESMDYPGTTPDVSLDKSERDSGLPLDDHDNSSSGPSPLSFANLEQERRPVSEPPSPRGKAHELARDSGYQEINSPLLQRGSMDGAHREAPELYTAQSRESLSSRRSAEPMRISTETSSGWDLNVPRSRDHEGIERGLDVGHTRTYSRETDDTPLESTTKNRASYLFQSTPEHLKDGSIESGTPTPNAKSEVHDYFRAREGDSSLNAWEGATQASLNSRERAAFSPPPTGTLSPRAPLDTIPEEHHAQKRTAAETDVETPENSKGARRTQTPQSIRARERALSPTSGPPVTIPSRSGRSVDNPISTDELIGRLSWPAVDEDGGTVNIDRALTKSSSRQASNDQRSPSVMSTRSNKSAGQFRSPEELRSYSRTSNRSSTPTLRRIDRSLSGDLRAASRRGEAGSAVGARSSPKTIPFEAPPTPPSNDDEVMDAGASRSVDMSDVYVSERWDLSISKSADNVIQQGYGDAQASQASPTRPPNMRKRQSMHIMELESRLDQLVAENQALNEAKQSRAIAIDGQEGGEQMQDVVNSRDVQLQEKDNEISQMRVMLQPMQQEIARLTEINNGLTKANRNLVDDTNGRYATLQQEHAQAHEQWQITSRELEDARQEHGRLTVGMREIVEAEIATRLADRNSEIRELREELDVASEKIRALQVQIQSSKARDFLTIRDEDYFDGACQKLCQHVQQWVLRFSKTSDNRVCRISTDLKDDKIEARLDNAILDGSDVDKLLGDRIKRRDVFMSVVMTMVWEYVFTRYLFGMDREQRQKLKSLEKLLAEVGPPRAVAQWRATTLTLLAKRPSFVEQRDLDTEAVANEVFGLLCALLPPPSSSQQQLLTSLQKVIGIAVDLSVEMRTQRAEYIMLPPLQPEYDTNGDLVRKVHFNASLMNERSGMFSSNEELEQTHAVVKIVLFPLVVKKGDEVGEGEEEIVVCPAQVLVHNDNVRGKKIVRVQSGAMEIDDPRRSRQSLLSPQQSVAF